MSLNILCIASPGKENFARCFEECAVGEFGEGTFVHVERTMQGALRELCSRKYDASILAEYLIPTHEGCRLEDLQNPV